MEEVLGQIRSTFKELSQLNKFVTGHKKKAHRCLSIIREAFERIRKIFEEALNKREKELSFEVTNAMVCVCLK